MTPSLIDDDDDDRDTVSDNERGKTVLIHGTDLEGLNYPKLPPPLEGEDAGSERCLQSRPQHRR